MANGSRSPGDAGNVRSTVVVLGMFRSGTSLVSGMLDTLGVRMGPVRPRRNWMEQTSSSPTGTFENPDFRTFDHELLGIDERSALASLPLDWRDRVGRADTARARRLVRDSQGTFWGWKDPYTTLTLPALEPWLTNPRFVVVRRAPDAVVRAVVGQGWADAEQARRLSETVHAELAEQLRRYPEVPVLELEFDALREDPAGTVDRLASFSGVPASAEQRRSDAALARPPAVLGRARRRAAVRELVGLPMWVGFELKWSLRAGGGPWTPVVRRLSAELRKTLRLALTD